jgi:hypothetical protein
MEVIHFHFQEIVEESVGLLEDLFVHGKKLVLVYRLLRCQMMRVLFPIFVSDIQIL